MTPVMEGGASPSEGGYATATLATYTFDDTAKTFVQSTYAFNGTQQGPQINNSGVMATLSRGLLSLGTEYEFPYAGGTTGTTYNPPLTGSWAVELAGQGGGLVELLGQPVSPLVAAESCPSLATSESFQFVTLPAATTNSTSQQLTWSPQTETAYGSVEIGTSGSKVNFRSIQQFTLPSVGGKGAPANTPPTSASGACSSTFYGNTVNVPNPVIIVNPGGGQTVTPQAIVGIGPTGLLVESNGNSSATTSSPFYNDVLGAGTGAIGLPTPSSPLDIGSLTKAQYQGFVYGSGSYNGSSSPTGWTSVVASFGFPSVPASCKSVTSPAATLIYGGDFPGGNPAASAVQKAGGYGSCDLAIDLGAQDSSTNGLFRAAKVWIGSGFSGNGIGTSYSVPAVAIAGQLDGKFAIFLIGQDTTGTPNQTWGIYLLQSN
jgi:hypothetical protein